MDFTMVKASLYLLKEWSTQDYFNKAWKKDKGAFKKWAWFMKEISMKIRCGEKEI